jgi:hypothetical protein
MWETKTFKTRARMYAWLGRHKDQIEYVELYVNNAYGLQYRRLVRPRMTR